MVADDDPALAADMLAESLEIHASLGDRWRVASVAETIAEVIVAPRDALLAATMLGASAGLREHLGTPVPPAERAAYDRCLHTLREQLGPRGFRGAWRRGEPMQPDEGTRPAEPGSDREKSWPLRAAGSALSLDDELLGSHAEHLADCWLEDVGGN